VEGNLGVIVACGGLAVNREIGIVCPDSRGVSVALKQSLPPVLAKLP
jgi:hypothetical protein